MCLRLFCASWCHQHATMLRAAMAGKAGKVWSLPRFWVSIRSYKKQLVKKFWGKILDLAWLKFAAAALMLDMPKHKQIVYYKLSKHLVKLKVYTE